MRLSNRRIGLLFAILALTVSTTKAQTGLPAVPPDCERFVLEQVQKGAEIMRLLALESVEPAMLDQEWTDCRSIVFQHLQGGIQRAMERNAEDARRWREEMIRKADEGQRIIDQCRADGGDWDRRRNRCRTRAEREERLRQHDLRQQQRVEEAKAKREAKRRKTEEALRRMNAEEERRRAEKKAGG